MFSVRSVRLPAAAAPPGPPPARRQRRAGRRCPGSAPAPAAASDAAFESSSVRLRGERLLAVRRDLEEADARCHDVRASLPADRSDARSMPAARRARRGRRLEREQRARLAGLEADVARARGSGIARMRWPILSKSILTSGTARWRPALGLAGSSARSGACLRVLARLRSSPGLHGLLLVALRRERRRLGLRQHDR